MNSPLAFSPCIKTITHPVTTESALATEIPGALRAPLTQNW
jgi:hypothetical protein